MKHSKNIIFLLAAGTLVSACTMAPDYTRPESPVAETFNGVPAGTKELGKKHSAFLGWKNFYKDERLKKLIEVGLQNNRDLRVAVLNIEKVEAQYRITRSALMPNVNAGGSWQRSRTPETVSPTGAADTSNTFGANIGLVSYEADIWGRIRSLKGQAWENYLATAEAERTVRLTIVASIALQYFSCELTKEQLAIAENSLKLAKDYRDLTKRRYDNGVATELDYATSEAQYQSSIDSVEQLRATDEQGKNALAVLLGTKNVPAEKDLPPAKSIAGASIASSVPAGLPSELLSMRPDILAAEHSLKASNASIGAARAAFFPSITLSASAGFASTELSDLFKGPARTWSFVPSINIPIFNGGRLAAELDVAKLQKEIEIANYEKAIQTAFQEVSDEFAVLNTVEKRIAAQNAMLDAQKRRYEITKKNYDGGKASAFEVISAQQSYNSAQQSSLSTYFARLASQIRLYKSLGGGWTPDDFCPDAGTEPQTAPAGTLADIVTTPQDEQEEQLVPTSCAAMAAASFDED